MATTILAVGRIVQGDVHWRVAPPVVELVTDDQVDALIDEVFSKPGLGVEGSAGLWDVADDLDEGEWERCMSREAEAFAEAEEADAALVAQMQVEWEALQPHELLADEWDDDYDIGEDESRHPFYY